MDEKDKNKSFKRDVRLFQIFMCLVALFGFYLIFDIGAHECPSVSGHYFGLKLEALCRNIGKTGTLIILSILFVQLIQLVFPEQAVKRVRDIYNRFGK